MDQNDLDSFTVGLIKRTQERNKFLADLNLTVDEKTTELDIEEAVEKPLTKPLSSSPLKVDKDLHRAERVTVIDCLVKPQFSNSSLPLAERPVDDRKRQKLEQPIVKSFEKPVEKPTEEPKMVSYKPVSSRFSHKEEKPKEKENINKIPSQPMKNYKVDDSSDPCLLPLAARRALFERKLKGGSESSQNDNYVATSAFSAIKSEPVKVSSVTSSSTPSENVSSSLGPEVQDALAAFKEIEELSSDECVTLPLGIHRNEIVSQVNVSSEHEEIIEINNVPVDSNMCDEEEGEDDSDNSLGSNASSLLSNNDETVGGISQSTRIYPELPPLDDLVHEYVANTETKPSPNELCHLSPIKSYISSHPMPAPIESPKKPEKIEFQKPRCPPCLPGPSASTSATVAPLRTLSMYRREQKVRTNLSKTDEDDELSNDLESEAKKRELWKKYIETKSAKLDELKAEAEKYNHIIYQSFRALDLCVQTNNVNERIEAEKILLINVVKKAACVDELYRLQQEESIDLTDDPVGKVSFNKLTLLVKGDFFVSQAQCHDFYDYHFICLFTCGDKVIATDALSSIDAIQEASLNFTNKTVFENLKRNFKIRLDVYALALPKNKRNHEKKIGSMSIRLTPKSKTKVKYTHSPALKASPGNEKIKCNFKRIGFVNFTHENITKSRFELSNFMYTSPLEDQIMVDCKTGCHYNTKYSSYLNFQDQSGDFPVWNRRWCVLSGPFIYFWRFSEDEGDKQPMGTINLRHCVNPNFSKASTDICMRANSFIFITLEKKDKTLVPVKHLMAADIRKERDSWLESLNKVLSTIRLWELDALQPLDQNSLERIMK